MIYLSLREATSDGLLKLLDRVPVGDHVTFGSISVPTSIVLYENQLANRIGLFVVESGDVIGEVHFSDENVSGDVADYLGLDWLMSGEEKESKLHRLVEYRKGYLDGDGECPDNYGDGEYSAWNDVDY